MNYFFVLLSVFFIAYFFAGRMLRGAEVSDVGGVFWMTLFASSATFLFHSLH